MAQMIVGVHREARCVLTDRFQRQRRFTHKSAQGVGFKWLSAKSKNAFQSPGVMVWPPV